MSLADDQDFVTQLLERSERFVASELSKVAKEMTILKAKQTESQCKIASLQKDNEDLKAENVKIKAKLEKNNRRSRKPSETFRCKKP